MEVVLGMAAVRYNSRNGLVTLVPMKIGLELFDVLCVK